MELERLRGERPELVERVCSDFDARLAAAQQRGLSSSSAGVRATLSALVGAVEQALADEQSLADQAVAEREPSRSDEAGRIASEAAADAMATSI